MSDNLKMNGSPIHCPFEKVLTPVKIVRSADRVKEIVEQLRAQVIKDFNDPEKAVDRAKRIAEDYLSRLQF